MLFKSIPLRTSRTLFSSTFSPKFTNLKSNEIFNNNKYFRIPGFSNSVRGYKKISVGQNPEEIAELPTYKFAQEHRSRYRNELFFWGFSGTGALGNESYLTRPEKGGNLKYPKVKCRRAPTRSRFVTPDVTVRDVSAGSGFSIIAATVNGVPHSVFGCGLNTDSQIGYHESRPSEPLVCVSNLVPIRIPDIDSNGKERVNKVACGRAHTICRTNLGNLFSFGNNSFGQCGRKSIDGERYFGSRKIHRIRLPTDESVIEVFCGQDHSLFLTETGKVFACGWGADGQLGNGSFDSVGFPRQVMGDIEGEKIVRLSSAADCVLAINEKGQVFGWGNSEYGQLSAVTEQKQLNISRHLNLESVIGPIGDVAAGGSMCALLNESGIVFVWGYGILGMGPNVEELKYPTPLKQTLFGKSALNSNLKVSKIEAGLNHFAAITDKGELFTWGKNSKANLGIGTENDMNFPYRVSMPGLVRKVSLGQDHSVALARQLI